MATQSFFQQMYVAFRARTRFFTKVGSAAPTEASRVGVMYTTVTTNASGTAAIDLTGMGFTSIYDVVLTPVCPTANAADKIDCVLVGAPTTSVVNIKTWKPAVISLGILAIQVAAAAQVYVAVRGQIGL